MDDNFIKKRWPLENIRKRVENIKKIVGERSVDSTLEYYLKVAVNEYDALYLTYYHFKMWHCKLIYSTNWNLKPVGYNPRFNETFDWCDSSYTTTNLTASTTTTTIWNDSLYTWTVTNNNSFPF